MLAPREIAFDAKDRRIMCFAHIIDLCSKRVVLAASDGVEDSDDGYSLSDDNTTPQSDPISQARAVIRAILLRLQVALRCDLHDWY